MAWGDGPNGKAAMNRNVCVVGDPAQTIYSFAGASSWHLLQFADEFGPLSADINLNTDYRSTPEVVGLANRVLAAAPNREDYLKLVSAREKGYASAERPMTPMTWKHKVWRLASHDLLRRVRSPPIARF